jgi:hypothetical protein
MLLVYISYYNLIIYNNKRVLVDASSCRLRSSLILDNL